MSGLLIVIVTHRSATTLPAAWASVMAQLPDLPGHIASALRLRVVDSASPDDTPDVARRLALEARQAGVDADVVALDRNVGYAAAINRGRQGRQSGESLVVMNPDVVLAAGCVARLLAALDNPSVGIAVPRLADPRGATLRSRRRQPTLRRMLGEALFGDRWPGRPPWLAEVCRDDHAADRVTDVDWATGAVMAMSPVGDTAVGNWDERYFLYGEEVDVARRARAHGFRVRYVPTACAVHLEGGSGRRPELTALATWNRIRDLAWHRGVASAVTGWVIAVVHSVVRGRRREERQVLRWLVAHPHRPVSSLLRLLTEVP